MSGMGLPGKKRSINFGITRNRNGLALQMGHSDFPKQASVCQL